MVARSEVMEGPALAPGAGGPGGSNGSSLESVEAVVLAGGHCWGENPLERVVCRPLVPIAGRPLLVHTLDWLREGGIRRINICVNQEARQIRRLLGDGSSLGVTLNYFEDVMPRGPAGCVRDVASLSDARRFLVLEGTILPRLDLRELLSAAARSVLTVVSTPARTGRGGRERFFGPAGIYVFSRGAFTHVPEMGYQDIKETLIPRLHVNGEPVETLVVDARSVSSVSGLGSYLGVSHQVVEEMAHRPAFDGYLRVNGALLHHSARVDASARLIGPVLVGPGADVRAGCVVVGPACIGSRTRIGPGCVVCRSVLWSDCAIEARAVLDQCIVTNDSLVRAGRELRHFVVVPSRRQARAAMRDAGVSGGRRPELVGLAGPILYGAPVDPGTERAHKGGVALGPVVAAGVAADARRSEVEA